MAINESALQNRPRDLDENYLNVTNSSHFPESIFNFPISDVYKVILEKSQGSYLGAAAQAVLTTIYAVLIALGLIGNLLVAFVIGRKSQLRTTRNLYIINLTISDVSMCLVCMPFTLVGLLKKNWSLGNVICKLIPALQCTNILVSTATIVAIATDRYMTIVLGNQGYGARTNVLCSVVLIWMASLGFTFPLFIFYYVERVTLREIILYDRCMDNWHPPIVKALWTLCLLLIQYVIPILVLGYVHVRIKNFLTQNQASQRDPRRMQREMERNRHTTTLLTSVALAFAVSWLPWHVVNFLADFHYSGFKDPGYFYGVFGGCHAVAMSTACSNPILYGWFNTILKTELSAVIASICKKIQCKTCARARCPSQTRLEPLTRVTITHQEKAEGRSPVARLGKRPLTSEHAFSAISVQSALAVSGDVVRSSDVSGDVGVWSKEESTEECQERDSVTLFSKQGLKKGQTSTGGQVLNQWKAESNHCVVKIEPDLCYISGIPDEPKSIALAPSGTKSSNSIAITGTASSLTPLIATRASALCLNSISYSIANVKADDLSTTV